MLSSITSAFSVLTNLGKIKLVVQASYQVIVKLLAVLNVIEVEIKDTAASKVLDKYLPPVIKALSTIKELVEKYGKIFGINPAAASLLAQADVRAELKAATSALAVHV